jgi:hypothetical protein
MLGWAAFLFWRHCHTMQASLKKTLLLIAIAGISASLFMAPFCGFLFKCGCSWLWTTAGDHCNIHHVMPPHCPWCSYGYVGYFLPLVGFASGQSMAGVLLLRSTGNLLLSILATLLCFFAVGLLMGIITLTLVNYPHFIFS